MILSAEIKIILSLALCTVSRSTASPSADHPSRNDKNLPEQRAQDSTNDVVKQTPLDSDLTKPENLESYEIIFYHSYNLQNRSSVSDLTRKALQVRLHYAVYSDLLMQRYDSFSELKHSGGPRADQQLCLRQLAHLNHRAELQSRDNYDSKDINLALLLDTYGRRPSSVYLGSGLWPGDYRECERLTIETPEGAAQTRYCVAHLRHKSWKRNDSPMDRMTVMKSGVCLPRSCDSLNHGSKHDLVLSLMIAGKIISNDSQVELTSLYCLPDEESPLRTWWLQPGTVIVLVSLLLWLAVLTYATIKSTDESLLGADKRNILSSLSIGNNLRYLFGETRRLKRDVAIRTDGTHLEDAVQSQAARKMPKIVDFSVADGIKVLTMMYVITGHVIMCMLHVVHNAHDLRDGTFFSHLANMAPAFAVNIFFGITGLLTSYQTFKQNQSLTLITNPIRWFAFIMQRYIRIMPTYIIVVIYAKYLAKYMGSGPFWDYGTSALAHRRNCEQESWFWTLSLTANFKSPLTHCIPSAWYLADDFQFFLIAPLFLAVLKANSKLGKTLLIVSITAVYWINFAGVFSNDLENFIPIAQFMSHGFKNYVTYLHNFYTRPHYRIGAYLCGLLCGYYLYSFEKKKLQMLDAEEKRPDSANSGVSKAMVAFRKYCPPVSIILILLMIASPFISMRISFTKTSAKVMTALAQPYYHIIYALAICLFVQISSTGHGYHQLNRFLSWSLWKPMSKLSLCVCLVNVEVIIYLTQIRTQIMTLDLISHTMLILFSILACYLVAIVLYVLFEAPIRLLLDHLLSGAIVVRKKETKGTTVTTSEESQFKRTDMKLTVSSELTD